MKSKYLIIMALGALLAVLGSVSAEEKELSKNQVPKAVIAAFEKAYPNAKGLEFEEEMFEDKVAYEVEYKKNGMEYEFLYSADGILLQKEEEIDGEMLPAAVTKAIRKTHPKAVIQEAEQVMRPDGAVTGYEVEIKSSNKDIELDLDTKGNILKTESESE